MSKFAWVETTAQGVAIRIFRRHSAITRQAYVCFMSRAEAVTQIRHQLWLRCKGFCEMCGDTVIEKSGHMHEIKHRGKGGEISLDNSVFICPKCHELQHGDRKPRWTKTEKNA